MDSKKGDSDFLRSIIQHIKLVEDNCNKLAIKMQDEDFTFSLKLIQLGRIHDASKFELQEFYHLRPESNLFEWALAHHHKNNPHHPEHWEGGIKAMPVIYLAEMVCDCVARGQEFGTDTRKWFADVATIKYNFSMDDDYGKEITKFLDLLLKKPFN